jgi:hypothetical protein
MSIDFEMSLSHPPNDADRAQLLITYVIETALLLDLLAPPK